MSAVTRPRGPLPRRVYWVRRLLVVGLAPILAFGLVFGIAHALGAGGGSAPTARPVAATASVTPSVTPGASTPATPSTGTPTGAALKAKRTLAPPTGPCQASDLLVTPQVVDAHVGQPISIRLRLTTVQEQACTWEVSPTSVFVTISSAAGQLWSSQQCPTSVPTASVVPRQAKAATVTMQWNGKQSAPRCAPATPWVWPGTYTVSAIARGAVTPEQQQFVLQHAVRPTETVTPTPTPSPKARRSTTPRPSPNGSATASPSGSASPTHD